jgi:DNA-binding XRE family transcriptional regulator
MHDSLEQKRLERFGAKLREMRQDSGYRTMRSFAPKIHITLKALYNIEAGRNWPSMPVYLRICKELKMPEPPLFYS